MYMRVKTFNFLKRHIYALQFKVKLLLDLYLEMGLVLLNILALLAVVQASFTDSFYLRFWLLSLVSDEFSFDKIIFYEDFNIGFGTKYKLFLSVCRFVCLWLINVKPAEFFVGPLMTPGKVFVTLTKKILENSWIFLKMR